MLIENCKSIGNEKQNDFFELRLRMIIKILLGITVSSHPNASFTYYIFAITVISTTKPTHPSARQLLYKKIILLVCCATTTTSLPCVKVKVAVARRKCSL